MTDVETLKQEMHMALTDVTATDIRKCIDYLNSRGYLGGVPGWKPIETVPMCEDIDVWTQYGRYVRCQHGDYGHWYIWSDEFNKYVKLSPSTKPTHWMPLPPAPKGETK